MGSANFGRVIRIVAGFLMACSGSRAKPDLSPAASAQEAGQAPTAVALKRELIAKFGEPRRSRIEQGVDQVAALWRESDGDLADFGRAQFIPDEGVLDATFTRLEVVNEQLDGHLNEMLRELKQGTDLDLGPLLPVDPLLSSLDPSAHLSEDLFRSKVAFSVLLNFPVVPLQSKLSDGEKYSRRRWAEVRLADRFASRIPSEVRQEIAQASSDTDLYVAQYNLWMHHLIAPGGRRPFAKGLRLISHWNLRDELKADYADPNGLEKQRLILQAMERIVTQTIPVAVIDNPAVDWEPESNTVKPAPAEEVEEGGQKRALDSSSPEPNIRYAKLLAHYQAARKADPYSPTAPTAIARKFEVERELPEQRVTAMLTEILSSPLVPRVAALIEKRLSRKLAPQDLWYNGFQSRSKFPEKQLDAMTRKKYPTPQAFAADIPRILQKLSFSKGQAQYLHAHIVVDPSRGAGHALPSQRRGDFPHLRTRVEKGGMDYKGYNIAVHELGHNVEQVFSLYQVDHTLLAGVPNNAFTEALAFVFQARDLELLGLSKLDPEAEQMRVLNDFWQTWEIAGVALVDLAVWHWMYEHPSATPERLKEAVVQIAKDHWNRFYLPVLGEKDSVLLGIYSHMIAYPLYLADYPLGHLIAFQIEEHLKTNKALGAEFERMAKFGRVTPDLWMIHATGAPVGTGPLLRATEQAMAHPLK